ncbi:MAG: hypothetical protein J6Z36_00920, partial [Clostridia bacterium]|nr:hypothetical protein [Clostridia bacterium]
MKRPIGLGVLLWISFFVFAVLIIAVCESSQIVLIRSMYREQTVRNLQTAGEEISNDLSRRTGQPFLGGYLMEVSKRYGVTAQIVSEDGIVIAPVVVDETEQSYAEQMEEIKSNVGLGVYATDESDTFAYAVQIKIQDSNGESTGYLYITDTVYLDKDAFWIMGFQTIYVAIIMLIVVTVLSGAVSMYITRPITDLTENARKLSCGNLSVDFSEAEGVSYKEIIELSETLNYAEGELSKADQMQKELIANVSHDFKTPLTMIKAYAAMIQEISGNNPEKRQKHTQVIIDEADRLAALVNDMLDLSKLRAGIDSLKPTLFNLSDCLRTVVSRFDYLRETAGYTFVTEIDDDLFIEADKGKISQVLYNLIGNAVNYTGEDKKIIVRLYAENGVVHFGVIDTGKGIPHEELDTIWERYYRSSETHKRPVKGTGLGLSIVKTILTKHEFYFGVRSEV